MKITKNTVSLLTITQYTRFESLKILFLMIQRQTYQNINEWVIVEGSQNKDDADKNKVNIKSFINEIKSEINFTINYIEYTGFKLGGLRNIGNSVCNSNFIICLDDDDWYPKERIEEAVNKLKNSNCLIGGVSDVYMYDFLLDKLYKFNGFMIYHSTNNCMAYKKEYLLTHKHDENIMVGEERSFTFEFTTPLVKFDSKKTIIAISHIYNTFNKRELCLNGTLKILNTLVEINEPITNYIDEDIYLKLKKLYVINKDSEYDMVIILGAFNNFNPKNKIFSFDDSLIIEHINYLKNKGYKIAVYGKFETNFKFNKIEYINWQQFPFEHNYNNILLLGNSGLLTILPFPINAKNIIWDSNENYFNNDLVINTWKKYGNKVNKIFLKSEFHKNQFETLLEHFNDQEIFIIPNGLQIYKNISVKRIPYRFCYSNPFNKGLIYLITDIFSVIKSLEHRAEFHIYGDISCITDNDELNKLNNAFSNNGVCYHGDVSKEVIAREKHLSTFELFITNYINDVDNISIRESVVYGCIPLIANCGFYKETQGIKYDMNHTDPKVMKKIALFILKLMKENTNNISFNKDYLTWDQVFDKYYNIVKLVKN